MMSGNGDNGNILQLDSIAGRRLLKKLIIDTIPEFAEPDLSLISAMNVLRRWVSANIPQGRTTDIMGASIFHNIVACLTGKGSVLCGGMAHILGYIYGIFGIDAAIYNYGIPGVFTHVVTLASPDGCCYVQDPTMNATYVSRDGAPLQLQDMCALLKKHQDAEIVMAGENGVQLWGNFKFDLTDVVHVCAMDSESHRRMSFEGIAKSLTESETAIEWSSLHGFPNSLMYIFLSRLEVSPARGSFPHSSHIMTMVENNTIPYDSGIRHG